MTEQTTATAVFAALADPSRRAVLTVLARDGGGSASDLARVLPISRQAIAKHLGVLEDSGLVQRERTGRAIRYVVLADPLRSAADWLRELAVSWDDRLDALREAAERPSTD